MSTHSHNTTPQTNRSGRANVFNVEERFLREVRQRFRELRGLIRRTVGYENDALQLRDDGESRTPLGNAEEREAFDFPSREGITTAFLKWLRGALRDGVLEPLDREDVADGKHWTAKYLRQAYIQGANQATGLLFQQGVSAENPDAEALLNRPIHAKSLKDLYQRTYANLESITDDMAPAVRETLTEGYAQGWNPRKMADELTNEVRDIQRSRAETLARSEIMNAHSSATLDTYRREGVDAVSHTEWSDSNDTRVCAFCRRLDNVELGLDEVATGAVEWRGQTYRLQPPSHCNGRCVLLPSIGGSLDGSLAERLEEEFGNITVLSGG